MFATKALSRFLLLLIGCFCFAIVCCKKDACILQDSDQSLAADIEFVLTDMPDDFKALQVHLQENNETRLAVRISANERLVFSLKPELSTTIIYHGKPAVLAKGYVGSKPADWVSLLIYDKQLYLRFIAKNALHVIEKGETSAYVFDNRVTQAKARSLLASKTDRNQNMACALKESASKSAKRIATTPRAKELYVVIHETEAGIPRLVESVFELLESLESAAIASNIHKHIHINLGTDNPTWSDAAKAYKRNWEDKAYPLYAAAYADKLDRTIFVALTKKGWNKKGRTLGLASVNSLGKTWETQNATGSVAIVANKPYDSNAAGTLAHELGHVLGADHNDAMYTCKPCILPNHRGVYVDIMYTYLTSMNFSQAVHKLPVNIAAIQKNWEL